MATPNQESEPKQQDTSNKQQEINKILFLISTKWIDVLRLLAEISQLQMELFMKLMNGEKK